MTLFAHTVSLTGGGLTEIWTELLCQPVEHIFFLAVAIFANLKHKLVLLDLNETLIIINNIQGLIDIRSVIRHARELR
jgi:predicted HAD superfamily phosphohydrolase YqeG